MAIIEDDTTLSESPGVSHSPTKCGIDAAYQGGVVHALRLARSASLEDQQRYPLQ